MLIEISMHFFLLRISRQDCSMFFNGGEMKEEGGTARIVNT